MEGGAARSRSRASDRPAHLSARVSRCQSSQEVSISRSPATYGGAIRSVVTVPILPEPDAAWEPCANREAVRRVFGS
ncbi:hypothetical protein GCM10010106_09570 [Thermopolyspora flexuosa]|nr:hypothetical protein GCM10010106_09570 [Thermopolyspora flexuosa]